MTPEERQQHLAEIRHYLERHLLHYRSNSASPPQYLRHIDWLLAEVERLERELQEVLSNELKQGLKRGLHFVEGWDKK